MKCNKIDVVLFNSQMNYICFSRALILSIPSPVFIEIIQIKNKA